MLYQLKQFVREGVTKLPEMVSLTNSIGQDFTRSASQEIVLMVSLKDLSYYKHHKYLTTS